jgi:CDGSH-type Zn-finger protein/uncharacterized Fe-S cluster protein YjdI
MKERIITYRGKDITVTFHVDRCTHVAECLRGAPEVFDSGRRPWVEPDAADPDKVAEVVVRCPTGALHFKRNDGGPDESIPKENVLNLQKNGPVWVKGDLEIHNSEGAVLFRDTRVAFCRCGGSAHPPFCDGMHLFTGFRDDGRIGRPPASGSEESAQPGGLVITLQTNGALLVNGPLILMTADGKEEYRGGRALLCRCGASRNKPFCDGSHKKTGFTANP